MMGQNEKEQSIGNRSSLGLVLEGGGMRGMYTTAVLDVFMEAGLLFDGVIGVSAGAIHGGTYLSKQIGRNLRYYKNYCQDDRFISVKNLITTGNMVGTQFCYHDLPERLDPVDYETFDENVKTIAYYAACCDLETGKTIYPRITDLRTQIDYLRASGSLPFISQIVELDGRKLLDGSCSDSIPIRAFRKMGYERNVIILTREAGYVKKPAAIWPYLIRYRRYPNFIKAVKHRHETYNKTLRYIEKLEAAGKVFVFRPSESPDVGRMERDPEKIQRVYDMGRRDALARLDELKKWMSQEPENQKSGNEKKIN